MTRLQRGIEYKIKGYYYRWTVIDTHEVDGTLYQLMESSVGDESAYIVINDSAIVEKLAYNRGEIWLPTIVNPDDAVVCETYDDIITALEDEGIL